MEGYQKIERLKNLVEASALLDEQLKEILTNLSNLEEVMFYGEAISDRVNKTFNLYSEFKEVLNK